MANLLWILAAACVVALVAWCGWLLGALMKERVYRKQTEKATAETQAMICQGVETICAKLDELADASPMDEETRRGFADRLNELMNYSLDDAMKAAKPGYGSDGK